MTGGSAAGLGTGSLSQFDAVKRAASCPEGDTAKATTSGSFYLVDDQGQDASSPARPRRAPTSTGGHERARSRAARTRRSSRSRRARSSSAPSRPDDAKPSNRFFVLQDNPELSGTDIKEPGAELRQRRRRQRHPIVTFEFTDRGRDQLAGHDARLAERGQEQFIPGQDPASAFQHFAIVLDSELVSVPFIDFRENPDGIDGRTGAQISGGFTIAAPRTSPTC